jgi:ABC-2 type transport system ATP-binding protein
MATVLETRRLTRRFSGRTAVQSVSLRVEEGETFGFLGRNGAGKSTFIQMVCGVIAPDDGEITLLGRTAKAVPAAWLHHIGYVAQEPRFDPWLTATGLGDFVAPFFPTWDRAFYRELLEILTVPDRQRIETLSVGVRARLALAVALAHRPRLLILDEPTAGLEPLARRDFHVLLERTAASHPRATFFSSHLVDDVERLAGRIGIIDDGALMYQGPVAGLGDEVRRFDAASRPALPPGVATLGVANEHPGMLVGRATPTVWATFGGEAIPLSFEDALVAMLGRKRER